MNIDETYNVIIWLSLIVVAPMGLYLILVGAATFSDYVWTTVSVVYAQLGHSRRQVATRVFVRWRGDEWTIYDSENPIFAAFDTLIRDLLGDPNFQNEVTTTLLSDGEVRMSVRMYYECAALQPLVDVMKENRRREEEKLRQADEEAARQKRLEEESITDLRRDIATGRRA